MAIKTQEKTKCYKIYNCLYTCFWMGDSGSQIIKIFKVHFIFYRVIKKFHSKILPVVSQKLYSLQYLNKFFLEIILKHEGYTVFQKLFWDACEQKNLEKLGFKAYHCIVTKNIRDLHSISKAPFIFLNLKL